MTQKEGFSDRELVRFRRLAFEAIEKNLVTGFNYYEDSLELKYRDSVYIPLKYGHRKQSFISLLEEAVAKEFGDDIVKQRLFRTVIYRWHKVFPFPERDDAIRLYDIEKDIYIDNIDAYKRTSDKLLAEGKELSLVFLPQPISLVDLAHFLVRKGSYYLTDTLGNLIPVSNKPNEFRLNPERLSDEAYLIPMIITSYQEELVHRLPSFAPVTKLFKIKGQEEISTYVDKNYDSFTKQCRVKFNGKKKKLANKIFRDFINSESQI